MYTTIFIDKSKIYTINMKNNERKNITKNNAIQKNLLQHYNLKHKLQNEPKAKKNTIHFITLQIHVIRKHCH